MFKQMPVRSSKVISETLPAAVASCSSPPSGGGNRERTCTRSRDSGRLGEKRNMVQACPCGSRQLAPVPAVSHSRPHVLKMCLFCGEE